MEDNGLRERVRSKEEVFSGKLLSVERWQAEVADGRIAPREIVKHPGGAGVVALDSRGNVCLVQQYRIAMGRVMMEIPAGKRDSPEEDFLACARRELSEETGLTADHWQSLVALDTSPGFLTERIGVYLATRLAQGSQHPDEDERLRLRWMPLSEAVSLVMAGGITDAKTVAGLLMSWEITRKTAGA